MITSYLEHHFAADPNDDFKTEGWTRLVARILALAGGCLVLPILSLLTLGLDLENIQSKFSDQSSEDIFCISK